MPRRYCSPGTSRRAEASLLKRSAASIAAAEAVSQRQARELNACPLSERCPAVNGGYGRILLKNSKVERLSKSSPSRLRRMYASRWCRKSAVRLRRYLDRSRRGPSRLSIPDESSTLKIQGLCVFQQYPRKAEPPKLAQQRNGGFGAEIGESCRISPCPLLRTDSIRSVAS